MSPVRQVVNPATLRPGAPDRAFSYGYRVDDTIWISGCVPLDARGNLVGSGDVEAQARQAFANMKAIVEAAGGTLADVVKLNCYLIDPEHRETLQRVRGEVFRDPYPASILLYQPFIVAPGILVEVEGIAVLSH